jgi:hypothetical protein
MHVTFVITTACKKIGIEGIIHIVMNKDRSIKDTLPDEVWSLNHL